MCDRKVYCGDCKYYTVRTIRGHLLSEQCHAPNNLKEYSDYEKKILGCLKRPQDKNEKNNCKDYEKNLNLWKKFADFLFKEIN